MKTFRIVVGILALLVLAFFAVMMILPPIMNDQDALLELIFTVIGIPIFTLNMWAWFEPDLMETTLVVYFISPARDSNH